MLGFPEMASRAYASSRAGRVSDKSALLRAGWHVTVNRTGVDGVHIKVTLLCTPNKLMHHMAQHVSCLLQRAQFRYSRICLMPVGSWLENLVNLLHLGWKANH